MKAGRKSEPVLPHSGWQAAAGHEPAPGRLISSWRTGTADILLFIAGALHALTFASTALPAWMLPPLQIVLLAVLAAAVWRAAGWRRAARSAFCFGVGHFLAGLYWIFISLHVYGHMAVWLAALAVVLFAAFLALFPALAAGLATQLALNLPLAATQPAQASSPAGPARGEAGAESISRRAQSWSSGVMAVLTWAAAWTGVEWVRGHLFTGFPWLNIGYAHVDGPLAGWAPVFGVYGVAFMAALGAAALAGAVMWAGALRRAAIVILLATVLAGAGLRLSDWGIAPAGDAIAVRLVQGNVEQSNKFDPALILQTLERHLQLAGQPAEDDGFRPDLVVLPETAIPVFQDQMPPHLWRSWIDTSAAIGAPIVTGIALHTPAADGGSLFTNSVIGFSGDANPDDLVNGRVPWRYDKAHLVPFGEFVPYGFRWFVNAMVMPMGDFNRGARRQQPFAMAGQHIAFNICYEDVFGEELLPALHTGGDADPGATILANVSNLGWFGNSLALPQHLQIARMRSLETGRPSIRATNTGATAVIDHHGNVQERLPSFTTGVLDAHVQGTTGFTPYARWGNTPVVIAVVLVLLGGFACAGAYRRKRR